MHGQLWEEERKLLHKIIVDLKPNLCLEIGTWKGGGSTYQIASALVSNGKGFLITCEPDLQLFNIAKHTYETELSNSMPIKLMNSYSHGVISDLIDANTIPDFIFMDGPEDPNVAFNDLKAIEDHMEPGSIVAFHDWDIGKRVDGLISTKSKLVKPYIENNNKWSYVVGITSPISVGLSFWIRN